MVFEVLLSNDQGQKRAVVNGSLNQFRGVFSNLFLQDSGHHLPVAFMHRNDFLGGFAPLWFVANRTAEFGVKKRRQL